MYHIYDSLEFILMQQKLIIKGYNITLFDLTYTSRWIMFTYKRITIQKYHKWHKPYTSYQLSKHIHECSTKEGPTPSTHYGLSCHSSPNTWPIGSHQLPLYLRQQHYLCVREASYDQIVDVWFYNFSKYIYYWLFQWANLPPLRKFIITATYAYLIE